MLAICGDFTCHGRPEELRGVFDARTDLDIPRSPSWGTMTTRATATTSSATCSRTGVEVLDGTTLVLDGVGFAGVKGFGGGFQGYAVEAFGERALKRFVEAIHDEVQKLDAALRALQTPTKVALLHYAPIHDTLVGEPECIWPFLGCSRFATRLDTRRATVAFHGHAHRGAPAGTTDSGVPVFNVAMPVLQRGGRQLHIWSISSWNRDSTHRRSGHLEPGGHHDGILGELLLQRRKVEGTRNRVL